MGEGGVERFGTKRDDGEMGVRGDDDDEIIVTGKLRLRVKESSFYVSF